MSDDDSILEDFIQEAHDHLDGIENDLLVLEDQGAEVDAEVVNRIFRAIHSVKGGSGFLNLKRIEELAHTEEQLLKKVRSKEIIPNSELISVLLAGIDLLKELLDNYQTSDEFDVSDMVAQLKALEEGEDLNAAGAEESSDQGRHLDIKTENGKLHFCNSAGKTLFTLDPQVIADHKRQGQQTYLVEWEPQDLEDRHLEVLDKVTKGGTVIYCEQNVDQMLADCESPKTPFTMIYATLLDPDMIDAILPMHASRRRLLDVLPQTVQPERKTPRHQPRQKRGHPADNSLRVPVKTLNNLMGLAGELVLSRNHLIESLRSQDPGKIQAASQRVDVITSELQMAIMGTRMQSIDRVFSRFNRIVRELARMLGKKIHIQIKGNEVELDKTIIESIADPLTHLVRNAIDHGVETPEERLKTGKDEFGVVRLNAFHQAGSVIIEVSDDGKGIDPQKIKKKAKQRNLVEDRVLNEMTDQQLVNLLFMPGFSLAEKVTEISGCGVGMDVVFTNFAKLGGTVEIDSRLGRGTTTRIKLPLTLAIIPALIIAESGLQFAIPQSNLLELVSIPPESVKDTIQNVAGNPVLRLRGGLLPLVRLSDVLEIEPKFYRDLETGELQTDQRTSLTDRRMNRRQEDLRPEKDRRHRRRSSTNIAIVAAEQFRYGVIVDEFLDSEEIVVKPLGRFFDNCPHYGGSIIRGDGRIALILDIRSIAASQSLESVAQPMQLDTEKEHKVHHDNHSLLIISNGGEEQFAIPLEFVRRIDEISASQLENIAGRTAARYPHTSLPLVELDQIPQIPTRTDTDVVFVLIFHAEGREIGLAVPELIDSIEAHQAVDNTTFSLPGVMGSLIINGRTTLLVDLIELAHQRYPEWFRSPTDAQNAQRKSFQVLIVDDSKFYRDQLGKVVRQAGYSCQVAIDGLDAMNKIRTTKTPFDLILTDIEMPNLDGIGLIKQIRGGSLNPEVPLVAITTLAGKENESKILSAGADRYMVKLAKEDLLRVIQDYAKVKEVGPQ